MSRTVVLTCSLALVAGAFFGASCGADELVAPAALKQENIQQCRSYEKIMPNFLKAINAGQTEGLKSVVQGQLLVSPREGVPPPINDVLRAVFLTLNRLSLKPAEKGAARGQYCAPRESPPPIGEANEICEVRRSLEVLIHEGKGIGALNVVSPIVQSVIDYITGRGTGRVAHYEVAQTMSNLCTQDFNCRLSNSLDLTINFSAYLQLQDGKQLVSDLFTLAGKESFQQLLLPSNALTEDGFVAILQALRPAIQAADPAALDTAVSALPLSQQAKNDLKPLVEDLKKILMTPALIGPVRNALTCIQAKDTNDSIARMLYRLAIRDQQATLGITKLVESLKGLQQIDSRGSLIYLAGTLASAVRNDEQAIDSAASVCRTLLSTTPAPGQVRGNAELVLGTLGGRGIFGEVVCAADTLLFGCAGGKQPACELICKPDGGATCK